MFRPRRYGTDTDASFKISSYLCEASTLLEWSTPTSILRTINLVCIRVFVVLGGVERSNVLGRSQRNTS